MRGLEARESVGYITRSILLASLGNVRHSSSEGRQSCVALAVWSRPCRGGMAAAWGEVV